jgi:hypothetical protein
MATIKGVHYVTLAIYFTYNDNKTSEEDAIYFAKDLAINPDLDHILGGVSLNAVRVEEEF